MKAKSNYEDDLLCK